MKTPSIWGRLVLLNVLWLVSNACPKRSFQRLSVSFNTGRFGFDLAKVLGFMIMMECFDSFFQLTIQSFRGESD